MAGQSPQDEHKLPPHTRQHLGQAPRIAPAEGVSAPPAPLTRRASRPEEEQPDSPPLGFGWRETSESERQGESAPAYSLAVELRGKGGYSGPETDADSGKGCTAAAEGPGGLRELGFKVRDLEEMR
ncbi:unnamed protein product [Rangifer tarandus platyrhynchus]|uniref:Uncharacterized protein n=1 Tax=Rangifer tarandus platyrhynchus TaxID=3082113 RepID=A0AC59Z1F9_RANTA